MKHNPMILHGLLVLIICMGSAQPLSAAVVTRLEVHHGTANCQTALPVFDGNIRKRPMAIANEGGNNAFITCDFERDIASSGFGYIGIGFINRAGASGSVVNCTLVDGNVFLSTPVFFTRASDAMQPGFISAVSWSFEDIGGDNFGAPAISCSLPPGVDLVLLESMYNEEVGALDP